MMFNNYVQMSHQPMKEMKPILTTTRSLFKMPPLKISIKQRARRYSDAVLKRLVKRGQDNDYKR